MTGSSTPQNSLAKSPFKFLDAYTAQDKDRFFGREAEQQRLVELIFRSRLMVVYGQSGTGKSSLVQCGLANVMSSADYFPVMVRRRTNLLTALQNTLNGLLDKTDDPDIVGMATQLARYSMRPVYLIFDQFEELFISGDQAEQTQFFAVLKALYQSSASIKLLLVMREEYIAYLYPHEDNLPTIFDFRLRLEPMSKRNLHAVITGTCRVANIHITDEEETVEQIINNNQSQKNPFQLPYLQVYLDRLWRTVRARRSPGDLQPIVFDAALVSQLGKIEDVLAQFVDEQEHLISSELPQEDRPAVKTFLEALVTYEGTRRECKADVLATETGYIPALIKQIGEALEAARIVQFEDGTYELAHDSLAKVIDSGRSTEQRQINDILKRLREAHRDYISNNKADDLLLPQRRLAEMGLYETAIRQELARSTTEKGSIEQFIAESTNFLDRKRQAELDEQRKKNNRLKLTIAGVSVLLVGAVIAGVYAYGQQKQAQAAEQQAKAALNFVFLQRAKSAQSTGLRYQDYEEDSLAQKSFSEALSLLGTLPEKPDFPSEEKTADADFDQLKKNLNRHTTSK